MVSKFYMACQNNSGGYFYENEDVREYVIIEANSAEEATDKLDRITEDYDGYCPCCGERWSEFREEEGKDIPMIYENDVYEVRKGLFGNSAIIYRLDGTKEIVEFK